MWKSSNSGCMLVAIWICAYILCKMNLEIAESSWSRVILWYLLIYVRKKIKYLIGEQKIKKCYIPIPEIKPITGHIVLYINIYHDIILFQSKNYVISWNNHYLTKTYVLWMLKTFHITKNHVAIICLIQFFSCIADCG